MMRHRRPTHARRVEARLSSPLGAVVVEGFLSRLAFGIISFALPLYAHALGMSLAAIGLLMSTSLAVAVALKPAMGCLVDRFGVRTAYVTAVGLRSVVLLLLVFAAAPWQLFAVRALHGVAIALRDPAAGTVLIGLGGSKTVAQRFAWYQTAKTVAGSGGRFAAGVLLTLTLGSYAAVFAVAAVLSALPLGLALWRLRGPAVASLRPPPQEGGPTSVGLRRLVLPYAGLGFLATGTAYLMANLLPVLAVEYIGLSPAAAGSLYAISAVVALSGPAWGWLADHVSHRLVLSLRGAGNVLSSIVWLVWPTYAGLVAGKVADDLGKAAFRPAWGAVMARVADHDPRRRARIVSWLGAGEDLGEVAGPVVAGLIWSVWGLPALLMLRAVLGLATEAYTLRLDRRPPARAAEPVEEMTLTPLSRSFARRHSRR
jgi:MFS family permease